MSRETRYDAALRGRCPRCGRGALFRGWIALEETCSHCGARFERWAGSWTGATVGGYAVGAITAVLTLLVLWSFDALGPRAEWIVVGVALPMVVVTYRPTKALWIAVLHAMGYVFPDASSHSLREGRGMGHEGVSLDRGAPAADPAEGQPPRGDEG